MGDWSRGMDRRSTAYILPYWGYRRSIAYMNELYAMYPNFIYLQPREGRIEEIKW